MCLVLFFDGGEFSVFVGWECFFELWSGLEIR